MSNIKNVIGIELIFFHLLFSEYLCQQHQTNEEIVFKDSDSKKYCYVLSCCNMSKLLQMNFQSSKFKLKKFVNSWDREMNLTSYSTPPKVMCHMVNLTSTFCEGPQSSCLVEGVDTTFTLN